MQTKVTWSDDLASAIFYAQEGFPVNTSLEFWSQINVDPNDQEFRNLQRFDGFKQTFLKPDGSIYKTGEILKQPAVAKTLRLIAEKGVDEFYKGSILPKRLPPIYKLTVVYLPLRTLPNTMQIG